MGGHTASSKKNWRMDPRFGTLLLILSNFIAFTQNCIWLEISWIGVLALLICISGRFCSAMKWVLAFAGILFLQWAVLPVSPKIIATSFSIFANYSRRMFPCLMVGGMLIHTVSLKEFIVGLRALHVPQKLIIPISVTLRYFPAIKEEAGYIRDAMRLRSIRGLQKAEALIVPLMVSATATAEELSAAAVTRGIEDPVKKTSLLELHISIWDWVFVILAAIFLAAACFL